MAVLAAALLGVLLAAAYRHQLAAHRELVAQVATLKSDALAAWFRERRASAGLSSTSFPQAELYVAWRRDGDSAARDRLFQRLAQFAEAGGFSSVALLDPAGRVLWASEAHAALTDTVHPAWIADDPRGSDTRLRTYRDERGALHLDFLVPLPVDAEAGRPIVVYHTSVTDLLSPQIGDWVAPTRSGRVVVVHRHDGEVNVFGRVGTAGAEAVTHAVVPVEGSDAVAVRLALAATNGAPHVVEGRDSDGVPVVAAGRQAGDSGWIVVARVDRSEVLAAIRPTAVVAAVAAALVYLAALFAVGNLRKRQRAAIARGVEVVGAERERTMRLLSAVADASPDAIFAKDLDGRYTLVNRACSDIVGRPVEDILGRTDAEIFGEAAAAAVRANERAVIEEMRVATYEEEVDTAGGPRAFLATKGPLVDGSGRATGTFGISRDVTERLAAERAAIAQAATLRAALADLERFNRVLVDRELVMVKLKRRLNAYAVRLGEEPPFLGEATSTSEDDDG